MKSCTKYDFDLEKFDQGQNFETYHIRKISQNMLGYYTLGIICCWGGQRSNQIHLIIYNFASDCHRDFKLGLYFSL